MLNVGKSKTKEPLSLEEKEETQKCEQGQLNDNIQWLKVEEDHRSFSYADG
jgi:hypothetical protein